MQRILTIGFLILAVIAHPAISVPPAQAAGEILVAPNFEFGARLDLSGQLVKPSLSIAAGLGLDWIAIDFDWAALMPDPNHLPDLSALNEAIASARRSNTAVMLSLIHAPAWAMTPNGPEPNLTASLVISLARMYAGALRAIELYPAANTAQGWGAAPDAAAYAALYQATEAALNSNNQDILLVASLAPATGPEDTADRAFLKKLYQQGAASWMKVLGLRLPRLSGDPMADPKSQENLEQGMTVLRHYEVLRQVMLQNDHPQGLIWLTSFSWPASLTSGQVEAQTYWLALAYQLIRSQLYIGAAFFQQLNPPAMGDGVDIPYASLVLADASMHPVCTRLGKLTSLDGNVKTVSFQGPISKKTPLKATIKP